MIDEQGRAIVFLAVVEYEYGGDVGKEILSVHDTKEGAGNALKAAGYRPSAVFTSGGELYAYKGKTADDYPYGYIDEMQVMQ